jgi:hypothetical protein
MNKYILFLFIGILPLGYPNKNNQNMSLTQNHIATIEIPLLKIKKTILMPVLDSVINMEKHCSYFSDSSYFIFSFHKKYSTFNFISKIDYKDAFNILPPQGCFKINGHYFFLLFLNSEWFEKTGKVQKFKYEVTSEPFPPSDNDIVFEVNENNFTLKRKNTCE